MVEAFFKPLKSELVWRRVFAARDEVTSTITGHVDRFYNPSRYHSALAFASPVQYETTVAA